MPVETQHRIHFVRLTKAEYDALVQNQQTDPDTLYFATVSGKGFFLYMGEEHLGIAPSE